MDNNYNNIISLKFAQAEQPKFEEKKGKGYIEFGKANDYPDYLLTIYNQSPKHGAIIKGKAKYIYGGGFTDNTLKANSAGETWNQLLKKAIIDDEIFSGYYLQLCYNRAGKIKDVFHLEFYKVRTNKTCSEFYVKNDWQDNREQMRCYPAFDNKYDPKKPTKLLFIKQYNPKYDVYPLPSYFQGMNYIESDVQVSRYILGNANDGFAAGKAIQFFNGEPTEEQKAAVEKNLKKKFNGSEGDRVVIIFSKPGETPVTINDLGSTMLTKEDFAPINLLIQQEIFASHQITSPMLFGIKTEGQLGGRSELQDAYEIFNNTYVNERQQAHEETFNKLFTIIGIPESEIIPVEPLGFGLKEDLLLDVMPREYFMDKIGVDQKYYSLPPVRTQSLPGATSPTPAVDVSGTPIAAANDNIKNLTGRQHQNVMRIVRQFISGKLTREQAALMLKSGFQFTDSDVDVFLVEPTQQFSSEEDDSDILEFETVGESAENYTELNRVLAKDANYFADVKELSTLENKILELIKKDDKITAETIAQALKKPVTVIQAAIDGMTEAGVLITKGGSTKVPGVRPIGKTTEIFIRYRYDWRADITAEEKATGFDGSRPFCQKIIEMGKLYSRQDIELISERLGYSVWDRRGGWWTREDGSHSPSCRHSWYALTVVKKK